MEELHVGVARLEPQLVRPLLPIMSKFEVLPHDGLVSPVLAFLVFIERPKVFLIIQDLYLRQGLILAQLAIDPLLSLKLFQEEADSH